MRKPLARLVIPTGAAGVMLGVLAGGPAAPASAVNVTISPTVPTGQCFVINPYTGLPLDTNCITSTPTPITTATPTATATGTSTATPTATGTSTATATATATGTSTATPTATATGTATATATATAPPNGGGGTNLVLTPQEEDPGSTPTVTTTPFANPSGGSTSTATPAAGSTAQSPTLPSSAAPEVGEVVGSANQASGPSAAAPRPPATGNAGMAAAGERASALASVLGVVSAATVVGGARLLRLTLRR